MLTSVIIDCARFYSIEEVGFNTTKFGYNFRARLVKSCRFSQFHLVTERVLEQNEQPWKIMKHVGRESIYRMHLMRFYLQLKQDPHGTSVALFVGNLPKNISERNYENFLTVILGKGKFEFLEFEPALKNFLRTENCLFFKSMQFTN